ncbi:MAG TPA: hypothetical protein DEO87_07950, partial [Lachnospiraceae bacterium]|nr:hypothetical protein [Lachnospiraceae bacterium]
MGKLMKKHRRLFAIMAVIAVLFSLVRPENFKKVSAADPNTDQVATGSDAASEEVDGATSGDAGEVKTTESPATEMELVGDQNVTVDLIPAENDQKDDAAEPAEDIVDESAKTLSVRVEESGCNITINAPEGSIPYPYEELSVSAREITEGSAEYDYYLSQSAEALECDSAESISFARFFDIEIMRNGEKIEPLSPVEVKIEYDDAPVITDDAELSIVHFAEEGTEVIDDIEINDDATEIVYEQESFSVTATIVSNPPADPPKVNDKPFQWKTYVLLALVDSTYYMVQYDGTLKEVSERSDKITSDRLLMWTYVKEDDKYYLRYIYEGYDYNNLKLPTNPAYTYIDPTVDNGLSSDKVDHQDIINPETNETKTYFNSPKGHCAITIDSNGHIMGDNGKYLSVSDNRIVGNSSDGNNVVFKLAEATELQDYYSYKDDILGGDTSYGPLMAANHQVNHIDISIDDTVTANIPLAYGTYYYKDANDEWQELVITSDTNIQVTQKLNVTQDTLRNATLIAKDVDGNVLDNAYVITGYSSNSADDFDNTVQVRMEGVFKVSTAPVITPEWMANTFTDNNGNVYDYPTKRREKKITYSLYSIQHDVEFKYISDEYGQLYDVNRNPLSITTDVKLKKENFGYFEDGNTCPGLSADDRNKGVIPRAGLSGMDFTLSGDTNIELDLRPVAIEITNDFRAPDGTIIKPDKSYDIPFTVKQKTQNTDQASVIGKNIGSFSEEINVSDYEDNEHTVNSTVDKTGTGLVNDYNVDRGMVYVEEDYDSVPKTIVDTDGNTWIYRRSYIETEYVYRNVDNNDKYHVGKETSTENSKSNPEVLGNYSYFGEDGNEVDAFNRFLEFYSHNIYDKVIPPTKEEVNPYEGNGELGGVKVGDEIEYMITYTNYASTDETVTITDALDKNVEFV